MKRIQNATRPLLFALFCVPTCVLADPNPLPGSKLQDVTVFSRTYSTTGANSTVNGNLSAGDVATTGANSKVTGNVSSVNASNTGAAGMVGGNIESGGVTTTGDRAKVAGNITSSGAATLAANAKLAGGLVAGGAVTTGDAALVRGLIKSGGAATIGAHARIVGDVVTIGAITIDASGPGGSQSQLISSPVASSFAAGLADSASNDARSVNQTRSYLTGLGPGTALSATMSTNMTLDAGVYGAASFSTTAGTTLTLDGHGLDNQSWVFNITDILAVGADTRVVLANAGINDSIYWNTGGYASLGANATFLGTVLAETYISVGANTVVSGIGQSCGGLFSASSYVSTGDGSVLFGAGCRSQPVMGTVPEPTSFALLLGGMAWVSVAARRRSAWQARLAEDRPCDRPGRSHTPERV